ncbi:MULTISPECIES: hypothetical protein [Achromobacter]|uniref:Uncharacterized protein n=1 Tax=Achromobacter aegrifaciens TaxID=1287736 RepID=A0AAD2J4Q4_ACHAE|nr:MULTISPECIES: hypothetical protein [Achromobacter]CAB3921243.1 hypothetical protein LMG26684_05722 [Achromobacter mucicolens]CUJ70268.1 Uncharacterised protein [Achromobacter aegrifaciens]
MTDNTFPTLDRYREVVAAGLANAHSCPPETVSDMMDYYEAVIRGSWSVKAAPVDLIRLFYADWQTFRMKPGIDVGKKNDCMHGSGEAADNAGCEREAYGNHLAHRRR